VDSAWPAQNSILVFWHQHIFAVISYLSHFSQKQNITALVSGSEDGKMLQSLLKTFHFNIIQGSSTKDGYESLLRLQRNTADDEIILITPDGPKGPPTELKSGALHAARYSGKPLIAMYVCYEKFWQLKSWDRGVIPKPFSQFAITFSEPIYIDRDSSEPELKELKDKIESDLNGNKTRRRVEEPLH
jgi:Kdo2-lipid IVA 3' secondary acyltransferase